MSEDPKNPSRVPENDPADHDPGKETNPPDVVTRSHHLKVLTEKRELKDKYDQLAAWKEDQERASLDVDGKLNEKVEFYQNKALEAQETLKAKEAEISSYKQQEIDSRKLTGFLDSLQGNLDKDYWGLVDLDKITINPEDNRPDPASIQRLAEAFQTKHSRLIDHKGGPNIPGNHPSANPQANGALTMEQWKALPLADRKKRVGEIAKQ